VPPIEDQVNAMTFSVLWVAFSLNPHLVTRAFAAKNNGALKFAYAGVNPSVVNPFVVNPSGVNPSVVNTSIWNHSVVNPSVLNHSVVNPYAASSFGPFMSQVPGVLLGITAVALASDEVHATAVNSTRCTILSGV
jgi:hypothetical protein